MNRESAPMLAIVGGFLGAGKTTLILTAAELLARQGKRAAVILNDQDTGLVDTRHVEARSIETREIAHGCFCCRFSEFVAIANDLAASKPDVIFAEPVGSCIDLSASLIRPIQAAMYRDQLCIAPLTVLVDPAVAKGTLQQTTDSSMRYLIKHQLAEADIVCTTRQDLFPDPPSLPVPVDFHLSGKTGSGVEAWLNELLHSTRVPGARLLDVDYSEYADAEAALGWLNLHVNIRLQAPQSPALVCGPLLDRIDDTASRASITIAHLKVFDRTAGGWVKASICTNGALPHPEGDLMAEAALEHEVAINMRALADPEQLRALVLAAVKGIAGETTILHLRAFRPPAPQPEHRLASSSSMSLPDGLFE